MNLRTKKWGCALGITLLIVVGILIAGQFEQAFRVPKAQSPEAVLRSFPLYPGARDAKYYTKYWISSDPWAGSTSSLTFRANGPIQPILDFYTNTMMADEWEPYIVWTHLKKTLEIPIGIHLIKQPPWIYRAYREVSCEIVVRVEEVPEVWDERRKFIRVSVTLDVPHPVP